MIKLLDDERLIYKCCSLYYDEGKSQQEICNLLGVSRPSVSRMLKQGRDLGIVRIEVINPAQPAFNATERWLERRFGLKEAVVVANDERRDADAPAYTILAGAALQYLSRVLRNGEYIGISMGWTLLQTAKAEASSVPPVHCTFVPLVGGVGEGIETHANFLAGEFARRFGGQRLQLYSPAIFTNPAVLSGFRREQAVRAVFDSYDRLDAIVFGIGLPDSSRSTAVRLHYIEAEMLDDLAAMGAVGDISLQYYDKDGRTEPFAAYNRHVAGLSLADFASVPRRIAIAGGACKAAAVLGALRGGYVNVLITDEACAEGICEMVQAENREE